MPKNKLRPTSLSIFKKCGPVIIECVRKGMSLNHAAKCVPAGKTTVYKWRERGEAGEQPYKKWLDEIRAAEMELTQDMLLSINQAAMNDGRWQAAAWLLERRFPEEYSQHKVHDIKADESAVHINIVKDDYEKN